MPSSRRLVPAVSLVIGLAVIWTCPAHGQQCLEFGESGLPGDYALIPHDPSLAPSQITVEAWIRVHAIGDTTAMGAGGEQSVLDTRGSGGGYQFRLAGESFALGAGGVAEPNLIFAPNLVYPYRWHHMALTQDADTMRFYFDGNLVEKLPNVYQHDTLSDLYLGDLAGCATGCLWLRGEIDDVRIWNVSRTQTQITDAMHQKLTGSEPGLAGYWSFDDDTGTVVTDATANGNDGALYGNAALVPSSAPVGFVPLPAPVGLRTHGEEGLVRVRWTPLSDPGVGAYNVYRSDTLIVPVTPDHLLGSVSAADSVYDDASALLDHTYYYTVVAEDTEGNLGDRPQEAPGRRIQMPKDYLVGAYYWPRAAPWPAFVRSFLVPSQPPALGYYDSRDPAAIDQHLDWMEDYGVDFLAYEWLGQSSYEDMVLRENILPGLAGRPTTFTLYYHPEMLPDPGNIDPTQEDLLVSDFIYIADTYFDHPNMLRFNGRPVIILNRTNRFGGAFVEAFDRVRSELLQLGHDVYIVGDEITRIVDPDVDHMQILDAVTQWRSMSRPPRGGYCLEAASYGAVARYLSVWQRVAAAQGKAFIPCVSPGANTRQENPDYWIVPRESRAGAGPTSQLEEHIRTLRTYVDPQLKAVLIWSWNHWEGDTQIEPSIVSGPTSNDVSGTGLYSGGYTYTGYGTQCLELVQSLLGFDPGQVVLAAPPDNAVAQARRPTLAWNTVPDASAYHLQVASDPGFSTLVAEQDFLSAAATQTDTLAANTTFHWRVRARSGGGSGAWSVPFTFTTGTLVPVRLAYFTAEREGENTVTVRWRVLDAANHAGFHVYRDGGSEPNHRIRLTDDLLTDPQPAGPEPGDGMEYVFTDAAAPPVAVDYWLEENDRTGESRWYGPVRASAAEPKAWTLSLTRNRPNPVRSTTTLAFTVPAPTLAALQILDLNGRVVAVPFRRFCDPGPYQVVWDGCDNAGRPLPNGIYFYRLVAGEGTRTAKLLLLR